MKASRNKKGVVYWTDVIDGKRVKRENKTWKTLKEARDDYDNYMEQLINGQLPSKVVTYDQLVTEYIDYMSLSRKQSTISNRKAMLSNVVSKYLDIDNIKHISPGHIKQFQVNLLKDEKHFANSYLYKVQNVLKHLLDYAYKFNHIKKNPFDQVELVKRNEFEMKKEYTILTVQQYEEYSSVIDDVVYRTFFDVLFWCGLRSGEALALDIKDYDKNKKVLNVYKNYDNKNRVLTSTKTNVSRVVSIPDKCLTSLDNLINSYKKSEGKNFNVNNPLFRYDDRLPKTTLNRIKQEYLDNVNKEKESDFIPYFTFHELRHSHVSLLIHLGLEPKDIAERLGHSVKMVNDTYGHLYPERKDLLLERLNTL